MGDQQFYNYLTNQGVKFFLGFVKSVLKVHELISRTVTTYKRRNKPHKSFKNKLDRCFEVSKDTHEQPRIVCDIMEWKLHNGTKVYLCLALELATRAIVGYKVGLNHDTSLVINVIDQVNNNFSSESILFHSDQGSQFTIKEVVNKIQANRWIQSMSSKGNC